MTVWATVILILINIAFYALIKYVLLFCAITKTLQARFDNWYTSFLLAPFWLKANIKNVTIYSLKLYT
jgi:hypothetical protein